MLCHYHGRFPSVGNVLGNHVNDGEADGDVNDNDDDDDDHDD